LSAVRDDAGVEFPWFREGVLYGFLLYIVGEQPGVGEGLLELVTVFKDFGGGVEVV